MNQAFRKPSRSAAPQATTATRSGEWPSALFILIALIFGGASAAGILGHLLVQMVALVALAWAAFKYPWSARSFGTPLPSLFLAGLAAVIAVQLIPLPHSLWSGFPGRAQVASALDAAGLSAPAMPISLAPEATINSALALLIAAAAVALTLRVRGEPRLIPAAIAAAALFSILLGVAQVTGGTNSPLYFYEVTNHGSAVGFFANRNHFTTLALVSLPCIAMLCPGPRQSAQSGIAAAGPAAMLLMASLFVIFGVLMSKSVAGLVLVLPAIVASFFVYRNQQLGWPWLLILLAVGGTAFFLGFTYMPLLERLVLTDDYDLQARPFIYAQTMRMIAEYFPFGTGLGSFADVYDLHEDLRSVTDAYVNHAHNDYLEILLELGAAGLALLMAFFGWWLFRASKAWASQSRAAKAATVITVIILIHSAVDYPMRTAGILAIFAAACTIMARPLPRISRSC